MNGRKAKALRKEAKNSVVNGMELLRQAIKPRPRWIPKWIWTLGLRIYIYDSIEFRPIKRRTESMLDFYEE